MRTKSLTRSSKWTWVLIVVLSGCGSLGSPVQVVDRPLSERIDERNAELASAAEQAASDGVTTASTPESVAFSDTLASGDFLRLSVTTRGTHANLRSGPGSAYEALTSVPDGAEVLATGDQTGEWVYVVYGDFEGWLSNRRLAIGGDGSEAAVVEASEVDTSPVVYVVDGATIGVNMRAEPNAESELVSGAPLGSEVVGTGRTNGKWIEVTFNDVTGWASGNYLKPTDTADASDD